MAFKLKPMNASDRASLNALVCGDTSNCKLSALVHPFDKRRQGVKSASRSREMIFMATERDQRQTLPAEPLAANDLDLDLSLDTLIACGCRFHAMVADLFGVKPDPWHGSCDLDRRDRR
jgi:hypothetical protein